MILAGLLGTKSRHSRLSRTVAHVAVVVAVAGLVLSSAGCSSGGGSDSGRKSIVVTYACLGAVVRDLVGDAADVTVLMPNGADPHEWSPSAKDIAKLTRADLLVENGLGLEGGMTNAFEQAQSAGVHRFIAADHITVRHVGAGEGAVASDPDQAQGAPDPHLWLDPLTMRDVVAALAIDIKANLALDLSARATDLEARLARLNDQISTTMSAVPQDKRQLVTGHESLGYFAARYGFKLIGAIIPSLTTQSEASSADLAALEAKIRAAGVKAVFTELGTSTAVADAVGKDTGAKVVELNTHVVPPDGSYFTFLTGIADLIAGNLK
jgi:zinc/manganese transport system substrate-binding protein